MERPPTNYLLEPFEKALAAAETIGQLVKELQTSPVDPEVAEDARMIVTMIRDGLATEERLRVRVREARDKLITAVYVACPHLKLAELSRDSGIGDSLISRIAERNGAAPRTVRSRRQPGSGV